MQFVITAYDGEGMLDKRMELKACPFQLDDYAKFVRTFGFRLFMVFFIFTMFGIQLSFVPWSEGGLPMWAGIGEVIGYLHPDCLKCGKCVLACPTKIMTLKH